jgi:hypothetical protein
MSEQEGNPYNAKKPWHTPDKPTMDNADGLFFAPPEATSEEAPQEQEAEPSHNYKKRYDDLKKHYDQKISEFKQKEQELVAQARSAQPEYEPPKSVEELEEFKDQYPDFEDIRGDETFHKWAKEQPEQIQEWIYNNPDNALLASKAIDLYKLENGITQTKQSRKRQQQSQGSAADMVSTKTTSVDAKQPKIWTEREIAAMSLDQFDKYEEDIKQALSEGRVVAA